MEAVQLVLSEIRKKYDSKQIYSAGTTGSGRMIASIQIGADIVKNEITAHAVAAIQTEKDVRNRP